MRGQWGLVSWPRPPGQIAPFSGMGLTSGHLLGSQVTGMLAAMLLISAEAPKDHSQLTDRR